LYQGLDVLIANTISLREVQEDDLKILFEQERDPIANRMAAYPAKDEESFMTHWMNKIRDENRIFIRTILYNESVAGSIECWKKDGKWIVGYWIGRTIGEKASQRLRFNNSWCIKRYVLCMHTFPITIKLH
jgi:RimJ/RimL family protein N-acetyltransferase